MSALEVPGTVDTQMVLASRSPVREHHQARRKWLLWRADARCVCGSPPTGGVPVTPGKRRAGHSRKAPT